MRCSPCALNLNKDHLKTFHTVNFCKMNGKIDFFKPILECKVISNSDNQIVTS